jgi:hypothetical protein
MEGIIFCDVTPFSLEGTYPRPQESSQFRSENPKSDKDIGLDINKIEKETVLIVEFLLWNSVFLNSNSIPLCQ